MSVIEAPAPTTTTTGDLFTRAADLLEEFDFCQKYNKVIDSDGLVVAYCMYGAMVRARDDLGASDDQMLAAWRELANGLTERELNGPRDEKDSLVAWNDTPGRTKAEVVARVRLAAERARKKQKSS